MIFFEAHRRAKDVLVVGDFNGTRLWQTAEQIANFPKCNISEEYRIRGDRRALFCDLVANLVPVEDAKAIAGIH